MKVFVSFALFAFAAANPLATRDAPTVLADINALSAATVTLNDSITQFGDVSGLGAFPALLTVQFNTEKVSDDTHAAAEAVNKCSSFTPTESGQIAEAIVSFVPVINETINNLISQTADIQKASLDFGFVLVVHDLQQIKGYSGQLGDGLAQKLSAPYNQFAPQISAQIQAIFDRAITAYSASSPFSEFL